MDSFEKIANSLNAVDTHLDNIERIMKELIEEFKED